MKSQIVPVLFFCIVFPWIASRVFQTEGRRDTGHANCHECTNRSRPVRAFRPIEEAGLVINYAELSTKQINFLIP